MRITCRDAEHAMERGIDVWGEHAPLLAGFCRHNDCVENVERLLAAAKGSPVLPIYREVFLIEGPAASGKSTLDRLVLHLAGPALVDTTLSSLCGRFGRQVLSSLDVWMVLVNCLDARGDWSAAYGLICSCIAGEEVLIQELHRAAYRQECDHNWVLSGSPVPDAVRARARVITLAPPRASISHLAGRIIKDEGGGLRLAAAAGLGRYRRDRAAAGGGA